MEYIKTGEDATLVDGYEIPAAEYDTNMNADANRIVDLCKTILGLCDCEFAKAMDVSCIPGIVITRLILKSPNHC